MKIMRNTLLVLVLSLSSCSVVAASHDRIGRTENPVKISDVKNIGGFIGKRMSLNREVYLKEFPIDRYVDFVVERQHRDWNWTQAEQHGKWMESACLSALQAGDDELLQKAQDVFRRIAASQESSGYLGATALGYRSPERPIRGMDPYELYFVFHAFMSLYEQTGNVKALQAVERLAGYFLDNFGPGKHEFWPSSLRWPENRHKVLAGTSDFAGHSVHYSWEGTLLCDPMTRLYELTGKQKYLHWSQWVVENIDKWSGWDSFSRLDSVADGTLGVDQLQPYVHSHTFHMNFMGFLRLYRATGDRSLLRKVEGAWNDIYRRQMYITGGVSVAEHYEHGYVKPLSGNIVETCATMSWMQLTQMLLELTGDTRYADAMERLMVNHVFAAQDALTGSCRYHTAPNDVKPYGYFHGPDCCTASGHRIISLLPTFFYAEQGKRFYINQYVDSEYSGPGFAFSISGSYPESETMTIKITRGARKTLCLRMPGWCEDPQVSINGKRVEGTTSGGYLQIDRRWKPDDTITLTFPMRITWQKRQHHNEYPSYRLEGGEIMYKEVPAQSTPYALTRGPVVYALDMVWNPQLNDDDADLDHVVKIDTAAVLHAIDKPVSDLLGPAYEVIAQYKGSPCQLRLLPFANIGHWFRPNEAKPSPYADAFSYAIWLYPQDGNSYVPRHRFK